MQIQLIRASEVEGYLDRGAQFIDLRDRQDYETKHIRKAISMPYETFERAHRVLDKKKTYVLYCERGSTSMLAARKMMEEGYQVASLSGGIKAFFRNEKNVDSPA